MKRYLAFLLALTLCLGLFAACGKTEETKKSEKPKEQETVDMFADSIKSEQSLSADASRFVNFIQGEIISVSRAFESLVGEEVYVEYGKKSKEIQSSFCVTTTENIYYVAVRERTKDEIDNKTGLLSIHIIEAKNWTTEYVYRGDGKRVEEGIYIVQEAIKIVD